MIKVCWLIAIILLFAMNGVVFVGAITNGHIKKKKLFKVGFIETLLIAIIAYSIVPKETLDLYRYFEIIEFFESHNYSEALLFKVISYTGIYVGVTRSTFDILCYFIARFSNPNLLTFIVTFIYYAIVEYIAIDSLNEEECSFFTLFFIKLFNFSTTMVVFNVTGLRYPLAIAVFCLAAYWYFNNRIKKIFAILLFLLSLSIHSGILPFFFLFVILGWFKKVNKLMAFLLAAWSILGVEIANILMRVPNKYISSIGWKLRYYIVELANGWDLSQVVGIAIIVVLLTLCSIREMKFLRSEYDTYCFWCLMLILGSIWYWQLFGRYVYIVAILGIPYVCKMLRVNNRSSVNNVHPRVFIVLLLLMALAALQIRLTYKIYLPEISWIWEK